MATILLLRSISVIFRRDFQQAVKCRYVTDDFTSPPKEVVLRIFIALKNPSPSAGFEPANLGSSGKHANY
jgi:hypothetical protein